MSPFQPQAWVSHRFGVSEPIGWDKIITSQAGDEATAFELFWELLDEYLGMKRGHH
jgi:hypothetical protein